MVGQKWLIGVAIVLVVVILETIPLVLSGRSHLGARTAYRALETSLVVLALDRESPGSRGAPLALDLPTASGWRDASAAAHAEGL